MKRNIADCPRLPRLHLRISQSVTLEADVLDCGERIDFGTSEAHTYLSIMGRINYIQSKHALLGRLFQSLTLIRALIAFSSAFRQQLSWVAPDEFRKFLDTIDRYLLALIAGIDTFGSSGYDAAPWRVGELRQNNGSNGKSVSLGVTSGRGEMWVRV